MIPISMKKNSLLLLSIISTLGFSQTYVGEVFSNPQYAYAKIEFKQDTVRFSMPYLDNDIKYISSGIKELNGKWKINRQNEIWEFNLSLSEQKLCGELTISGSDQSVCFYEQLPGVSKNDIPAYCGTYKDDQNNRSIIYERFGYLHFMSPYSEETNSLKCTGMSRFWSASGEQSEFSEFKSDRYNKLRVTDRFGESHVLNFIPDYEEKEARVPIGGDTIYCKVFVPYKAENAPACLLLPGGGATGMENYEFEARLLASHGMVTMLFDKSGTGKTKGSGNFELQTLEEKNDQYKTLFKYLQKLPYVNDEKVGIHGPSEGGRLALLMAIDLGNDVAFVNGVAPPVATMLQGQLYAVDMHHRIMGLSESDNFRIQRIWYNYYQGIKAGKIEESIADSVRVFQKRGQRLFLPLASTQIPASPKKEDLFNNRIMEQGSKITCPIFIQFGENDLRVDPGMNTRLLRSLFKQDQLSIRIYERGGHSLMTPEYKICPGYTYDKIEWFRSVGILK